MMKQFLWLLVAVSPVAGGGPPGEAARADLEKLQGTWYLVSAKQDGKALPADKVKRTTLVFTGQHFRFPQEAEQATSKDGTIRLDPTQKPKHMDATSARGEVMRGIYALDGDRYQVCFAPAGKDRPTAFTSEPGTGHLHQVWTRTKPR